MSKKLNTQKAPSGTFRRVLSHDEGPNFWKPKKIGSVLIGKLLDVTKTKLSAVLQMQKDDGESIQVGVSTQLKRVPWETFVGSLIRLTYVDEVPTQYGKPCKRFDVDVADQA